MSGPDDDVIIIHGHNSNASSGGVVSTTVGTMNALLALLPGTISNQQVTNLVSDIDSMIANLT